MAQINRIVVVDEYRILCDAVAQAIARQENYQVDTLSYNAEVVKQAKKLQPDVLVLNAFYQKDRVLNIIRSLSLENPSIKIVIMGVLDNGRDILDFVEAGAAGYVHYTSSLENLLTTIDLVISNKTMCSPDVAYSLFSRLAELSVRVKPNGANGKTHLTSREMDVIDLIAEGRCNKEIANELLISISTVKNHVHNILEKLNLQRRLDIAKYAYEKGLTKGRETGLQTRYARKAS
jgi:DNA-binding NarL/FixJ family response regulator